MTGKAVKRTPHNYSVLRNIRQNSDNTDKAYTFLIGMRSAVQIR